MKCPAGQQAFTFDETSEQLQPVDRPRRTANLRAAELEVAQTKRTGGFAYMQALRELNGWASGFYSQETYDVERTRYLAGSFTAPSEATR